MRAGEPCESREPCEPSVRAIQIFENSKKKRGSTIKSVFTHCFSLFSLARSIVGAILFLKSSNSRQSLLFECFPLGGSLGRGLCRSSESLFGLREAFRG